MSELQLHCEVREQVGSSAAKKFRAKGLVPGVVYGHEKKPDPVVVPAGELRKVLSVTGGHAAVITLEVEEGGKRKKENVIIKEVQRFPTIDRILNVDFQRVSLQEKVRVDVPLALIGTAPGVDEGGMLDQVTHVLHIECPAGRIPERLEVDVSQLSIGDMVAASEVSLPKGVLLLSAPETVVATVVPPRVEVVEVAAPEPTVAEPELIRKKPTEEEASEA